MKKNKLMIFLFCLICINQAFTAPCGDVNSSGAIDIVDALMTAQFSVGLDPPGFDRNAADVSGDGAITIIDALQIAQFTVSIITELPGCRPSPTDPPAPTSPPGSKPRIIITQDGEKDDKDSMVRFLIYSCDYDVVGIVENNSRFQGHGHSSEEWIQKKIDAYAEVLPNLRVHNPDYPDPAYLKSVIKLGNENSNDLWSAPPDMETKDTPASQMIIDTLLDNDPRRVHVTAWGGANTVAFALWRLKTSYSQAEFNYGISRIWFFSISYQSRPQDGGNEWLRNNMPELQHFQSSWWSRTWNYSSTGSGSYNPAEVQEYMSSSWLNANVKSGHGALGALYGQDYVSEGDTPSFLPVINNGLEQYADCTLGGWGGRPVYLEGNYMNDGLEDPSKSSYEVYAKAFHRWIPDAQNDFAARMDWCVTSSYSGANHQPVAGVAGSYTKVPGGLRRNVSSGEIINLDGSPSTDPDGNSLSYKWWQYFECDSADTVIPISNSNFRNASFTVPNERGKELHIILTVRDNGSPSLAGYKRIIFKIQ